MSRIGKIPVEIPKEVKVNLVNSHIHLEGPNGKLYLDIPQGISVEDHKSQLIVTRTSDTKQNRSDQGTIRARLVKMIIGVTKGHKKDLELQGIGFRAQVQGNKIILNLGFSHPVEFAIPKEIKITVNQNMLSVEGPDLVQVGQIAAKIRDLKPVEPYKGKGIRYVGEIVKRKQGKSVTK